MEIKELKLSGTSSNLPRRDLYLHAPASASGGGRGKEDHSLDLPGNPWGGVPRGVFRGTPPGPQGDPRWTPTGNPQGTAQGTPQGEVWGPVWWSDLGTILGVM